MKQQLKPFDKVLVRDSDQGNWKAGIFSHYEKECDMPYTCIGSFYAQCIPYNENTAHLLGTNKPYKNELPQEKKIHVWTSGTFNEWMTEDEFKNFIKTAVLNNRDITDFHVLYIR